MHGNHVFVQWRTLHWFTECTGTCTVIIHNPYAVFGTLLLVNTGVASRQFKLHTYIHTYLTNQHV